MQFDSSQPATPLRAVSQVATQVFVTAARARRAAKGYANVSRFASRGDAFNFDPDGTYSYESIHVGDHVNLGTRPVMLATWGTIRIGNHVMFGPGVTIRGGNHRIDVVGRYMDSIREDEKRPEDDPGVVIEDDVWIGGNATILAGVRIGRGSVIAASAVVTKSVPPNSIAGGNPARVIRERFPAEELAIHEFLYDDQ